MPVAIDFDWGESEKNLWFNFNIPGGNKRNTDVILTKNYLKITKTPLFFECDFFGNVDFTRAEFQWEDSCLSLMLEKCEEDCAYWYSYKKPMSSSFSLEDQRERRERSVREKERWEREKKQKSLQEKAAREKEGQKCQWEIEKQGKNQLELSKEKELQRARKELLPTLYDSDDDSNDEDPSSSTLPQTNSSQLGERVEERRREERRGEVREKRDETRDERRDETRRDESVKRIEESEEESEKEEVFMEKAKNMTITEIAPMTKKRLERIQKKKNETGETKEINYEKVSFQLTKKPIGNVPLREEHLLQPFPHKLGERGEHQKNENSTIFIKIKADNLFKRSNFDAALALYEEIFDENMGDYLMCQILISICYCHFFLMKNGDTSIFDEWVQRTESTIKNLYRQKNQSKVDMPDMDLSGRRLWRLLQIVRAFSDYSVGRDSARAWMTVAPILDDSFGISQNALQLLRTLPFVSSRGKHLNDDSSPSNKSSFSPQLSPSALLHDLYFAM